ncbi:hypothetical protein DITRI_Ditri14bG0144500 [Diplodiscus trichospermus]
MEFSDYTQILFNRIKKIEPENVSKIIGYLLLQHYGDQEIVQLAMCPDVVIQEVIYKTKVELQQLALKSGSPPISPSLNSVPGSEFPSQFTSFSRQVSCRSFLSPGSFQITSPCWEQQIAAKHNLDFLPSSYLDSVSDLQTQTQFSSLEDQMESVNLGNSEFSNDYCSSDAAMGYCKHGSTCRYFHGQVSDNFFRMFGHNSMNLLNDDPVMSLEKLELDLVELLKTRRGEPISIASLPLLYYEKYGKVLQADGYLTESQRHGKAGYSLTKLLGRLKNTIRVIDRPHGQHSVILAEDAPEYIENRNDRNDPGPIVSGSRKIYLTFPADSTFSEDDVSNYFSNYGQVEDVRIPCQQKRMFGFVTFVSADTVKTILGKGNPHYVCGARVLVNLTGKNQSTLTDLSKAELHVSLSEIVFVLDCWCWTDCISLTVILSIRSANSRDFLSHLLHYRRKYQDRIDSPVYYSPNYIDMESELHSIPRGYAMSRLFRKQFLEDLEQIFQLERRHPPEIHLAQSQKPLAHQSFSGYSMDGLKVSEEFNYLLESLNTSTASDEKIKHVETNNNDQESEGLNLPDSPFASAIASSISAVI